MCGILYAHVADKRIDPREFEPLFERAVQRMVHRGPDKSTSIRDGRFFFGHTRLSIVGLGPPGNQPVQTDRKTLLFNGEIYNYRALSGQATSDTQALFQHLEGYGRDPFRAAGMFAIVYHDRQNRTTRLIRDVFGEKPLYYYTSPELQVASSTISSIGTLLHGLGLPLSLSSKAILADYLWFGYVREPDTVFEQVKAVPPGHEVEFLHEGKVSTRPIPRHDHTQSVDSIPTYITAAFESRDVDGALLLSGGIDSTFLLSEATLAESPLRVVTAKTGDSSTDESQQALRNLNRIDPNGLHDHTVLSIDSPTEDSFWSFIAQLEQPTSDSFQLFSLLRALRTKYPDLKLVYTGLGGDELFGGYNSFHRYQPVTIARRTLGPALRLHDRSKRFALPGSVIGSWNETTYAFLYRLDYDLMGRLTEDVPLYVAQSIKSFHGTLDNTWRSSVSVGETQRAGVRLAELYDYCRNQLLRDTDNVSMYFGLEARSPLLSTSALSRAPDAKRWMKNLMWERHRIDFGPKRGFSQSDKTLRAFYSRLVLSHTLPAIQKIGLPVKRIDSSVLRDTSLGARVHTLAHES